MVTLPSDERAVIRAIDKRLRMGLKQYGRLDVRKDPRRWTKEALEEALDLTVYLTCALMRLEMAAKPKRPKKKAVTP